jgi:hypothetical protein
MVPDFALSYCCKPRRTKIVHRPDACSSGNLGRHEMRGRCIATGHIGLAKQFLLREGISLNFRAEMFNLSNYTNCGNPVGTMCEGNFQKAITAR